MTSHSTLDGLTEELTKLTFSASTNQNETPNEDFRKEIKMSPFHCFECIADLGYYGWIPPQVPYKDLAAVTASEFKDNVYPHIKPNRVESIDKINSKLPLRYPFLPPQKHINKYPHRSSFVTALYVAVKHRGLKLNDIDFILGGSVLEVLAKKSIRSDVHYLTTLVPGTGIILVGKNDEYEINYSDPGFQFERLVTGKRIMERHDISCTKHLHVMEVSGYRILFAAEVDAVNENNTAIEITQGNPTYWGTKKAFQMISSGSILLYSGIKKEGKLVKVESKPLSHVIPNGLRGEDQKKLEFNIHQGLSILKKAMESNDIKDGEFLDIVFERQNSLVLQPFKRGTQCMLPPNDVVKDLLL